MKNFKLSLIALAVTALLIGCESGIPPLSNAAEASFCQDSLGIELPDCSGTAINQMLEGAPNFRPVVLSTKSPVRLKEGLLYRSGALHEISTKDVAVLEGLGVKTIVDFRYAAEIEEDPDREISSVEQALNFPIDRSKQSLDVQIDEDTYAQIRRWFIEGDYVKVDSTLKVLDIDVQDAREERYIEFALDYKHVYGDFMRTLADSSSLPLVFHCQGGKDRGGFASALLLKTLGASDAEVMDDFLTTNLHTYEELQYAYGQGVASLHPSIGAHASHLEAALAAIDTTYGSFETYLTDGLELTDAEIQQIRTNLTE